MATPSRGDVWLATLDPTVGREQAGTRPVLIVSSNILNHGPTDLLFVVPLTTRERRIRFHVEVRPPEGGIRERSFAKCEDVRSVSRERLLAGPWGTVSLRTLRQVEERLRALLEI